MGLISDRGAGAPPLYTPQSVAAGRGPAEANVHDFTLFRGMLGVSLDPSQRNGSVPFDSHVLNPVRGAAGSKPFGNPVPGASHSPMVLPPLVPIAGGPRDPSVMV